MKIFVSGHKVNFVDDHNSFVGYDTEQSCCETADWFIEDEHRNVIRAKDLHYLNGELHRYSFAIEQGEIERSDLYGDGGAIRFRLCCDGMPDRYVCLVNITGSYYHHAYEFITDGNTIQSGEI